MDLAWSLFRRHDDKAVSQSKKNKTPTKATIPEILIPLYGDCGDRNGDCVDRAEWRGGDSESGLPATSID